MFKFLKWFFKDNGFRSGVIDSGLGGIPLKEIVGTVNTVKWEEKSEYRTFPTFFQSNSFSCVAQSMAKIAGIIYKQKYGKYIKFSPAFIYKRRANRPEGGMRVDDVYRIVNEKGVNLYDFQPSDGLDDFLLDSQKEEKHYEDIASLFKLGSRISVPIDIDSIASVIQTTGKGVMLWFSFAYNEWVKVPTIKTDRPNLAHSVVAVDFTLWNGKKALVIEDSWGEPVKIITEDFFRRCYQASYPMNFKFDTTDKPKFDGTITSLQNCLKYLGHFPSNIESTGFFGELTKQALIKFQKQNGLNPEGVFGELTKAKLKELF